MSSDDLISAEDLKTELGSNGGDLKLIECCLMQLSEKRILGTNASTVLFTTCMLVDSNPDSVQKLQDTFTEFLGQSGISRTDKVVVYEEGFSTSSGVSCRAYTILKYLGVDNVRVLHGGVVEWQRLGFPMSKVLPPDESKPNAVKFEPAIRDDIFIDGEQMAASLKDPKVYVLDDRDKIEWVGEHSSPIGPDFCPRKGRIVGAHWLEWYDFWAVNDQGTAMYKSKEDIVARCAKAGLTDFSQRIHIYCFMGMRASNTYMALVRAGFSNLRVYLASWNEWSRNDSLPIDDKRLEE